VEEKRGPEEKRYAMDERIKILREELSRAEKGGEGNAALMTLEQDMRTATGERETYLRDLSRLEGEHAFITRRIAELTRRAQDEETATVPLRLVRTFITSLTQKVAQAYQQGALEAMRAALEEISQATEHFASTIRKEEVGELPELQKDAAEKQRQIDDLRGLLSKADTAEKALRARVQAMRKEMDDARAAGRDAERELFALMTERSEVEKAIMAVHAKEAQLAREEDEFKREREEGAVLIGRDILTYEEYEVDTADVFSEERALQEDRRRRLEKMKIRLEEQGLGSSEEVLREHTEVRERDAFLTREVEDLVRSAESLRALIAELTQTLQIRFADGITKINAAFDEFFKLMFGGGGAELTLVKDPVRKRASYGAGHDVEGVDDEISEDEDVEEGIEIGVHLPQKRIKGLHMLSGGERALTSIALIFAMSQVNPPPFLILDETDAALDEANSRRYGDMIESLAKHSQLILITHNRETMSRAGVLYGVTMGADGASKLLSVRFEEALAVAK
jgi:chromosome segregation protein